MAQCRINCCSRAPEHSRGTSSIVNASSRSSHSISALRISRWLTLISVKLVIVALLNNVMTTHGFLVTMTSPTSNDSSSLRLRCAFGTDLGNVSEVNLGKNETESGSWEIVFVYSGDNGTYQFLHKLAGRASAVIGGYHADITIGNATPEDCGLYGCQVTNRFNEVERNFTTIGCAALHTVNSNSTPTPTVPSSCSHLPVWATALIVLAGIVVAVLAVSGIIIAAFKITRKLTQVSPDSGRDLSAERNPRLTPGTVTNGAADNKGHSTAKRTGDRKQSLRYSSSQTSKEENDEKNTSKKQKKYKESRENSTESVSTKRPHDEDNGSKATLKRHKRRESRLKQFDDEEIAEEDGEENTAASQHSDQMSDVERGTRKNQRGNALPPLERKKKKKRKEGEEAMAVMYKDNP